MLVVYTGEDVIPQTLQLIAGRTAQEYNNRRRERGHSGTIDTMQKQFSLMSIWHNGYNEIQTHFKRYSIINRQALNNLFNTLAEGHFRQTHREWVDLELKNYEFKRQFFWSESAGL